MESGCGRPQKSCPHAWSLTVFLMIHITCLMSINIFLHQWKEHYHSLTPNFYLEWRYPEELSKLHHCTWQHIIHVRYPTFWNAEQILAFKVITQDCPKSICFGSPLRLEILITIHYKIISILQYCTCLV